MFMWLQQEDLNQPVLFETVSLNSNKAMQMGGSRHIADVHWEPAFLLFLC